MATKIEFTVHDHNFGREVLESPRPVVVEFTATWCWPCLRYEPLLAAAHAAFGEEVSLARMDIDKNHVVPERYGVVNVPTLLIFHRGKVLRAIDGIRDPRVLGETFRELARQTGGGVPPPGSGGGEVLAPR
jgi:thioredoxin 1